MRIAANPERSAVAASDGLRGIFGQYRTELEFLAYFVTADKSVTEACVVDACGIKETQSQRFQAWMKKWARHATIRTAIQSQRTRIAQLAALYERRACAHKTHPALASDSVELIVDESDRLIWKLDVLCRSALVICGIEKRPLNHAALVLGVSEASVQAAYCVALEHLEVLQCERFIQENASAAVWN